jgi:hypothetical protein
MHVMKQVNLLKRYAENIDWYPEGTDRIEASEKSHGSGLAYSGCQHAGGGGAPAETKYLNLIPGTPALISCVCLVHDIIGSQPEGAAKDAIQKERLRAGAGEVLAAVLFVEPRYV